ncbi:hypothetical protein Zmor_006216 [Zophobas morio]|uniref:Peptidase M12B domain-containing protein n=1 Tax=Zophobas morio TaxID=2755281 RepID=A0AA38ML79_9CUCU|nr:hypothetical protein Zmor_006216 [Zophobas morio]
MQIHSSQYKPITWTRPITDVGIAKLRQSLLEVDWSIFCRPLLDVNAASSVIVGTLSQLINEHLPLKKCKNDQSQIAPWFSKELRQFRDTLSAVKIVSDYNKLINETKKKAYDSYIERASSVSKGAWRLINHERNKKQHITGSAISSEKFNLHFTSLPESIVKNLPPVAGTPGLYSGALSSEAHETIPRKVSPNGDYISHNLTSFHDDGQVHFNISLHDREHLLILEPVRNFLAPALVVERRKRDTHSRSKPSDKSKNCHFQGIVHGQPNSRVAVSACNGLTGMLHTEHGKYYIEPSHHLIKQIDPGHPHLVYKRSTVVSGNAKKKKRKKRKKHFRDCGTREPKKMAELEWQKQLGKVKVQEKKHKNKHKIDIPSVHQSQMKKHKYKKVDGRQRRSVSTPQYVETLLVADPTMVEFHEDGDIETYLLTIMNMVSSLYMDPSIGNLIKVVVVKIILIDDVLSEPELNVSVNADQTLKNFCKWQKNLNPGNDSHPHHHDVAILITRKDICARQNAPCNTLGVAHVAGMCKSSRSCSVNEDNGITLAHTIAHEMGHNFGMYHDTEKIGCKARQGNTSHIMTPSFEADTVGVSWSRCSRRDITNFLDKGLGQCLQDEPEDNEIYEYPELPPGAMYNADYQCRFQFGGDATVCSPLDEICFRLWCMVNDTCTTQLRPAAPGTYCGKHKWCQDQKCLPIMEPPVAIDGGWGEWSSWSECSRTCGAGVSVTQRECDHPTPTAGGRFCIGERRRYRICNTDSCPDNKPTFRAVQCSTYNNRTYEGKKYEWQPYFDQGNVKLLNLKPTFLTIFNL